MRAKLDIGDLSRSPSDASVLFRSHLYRTEKKLNKDFLNPEPKLAPEQDLQHSASHLCRELKRDRTERVEEKRECV